MMITSTEQLGMAIRARRKALEVLRALGLTVEVERLGGESGDGKS